MVYSTFLHVVTPIPQVGRCKYSLEGETACRQKSFLYIHQFARAIFSHGDVQGEKEAQEENKD